ncbi:MAG: hypothetical protein NTW52_17910 [Planctomycetota bacterium]|nr:hypothetical protein [Planctomycetota bacterium]
MFCIEPLERAALSGVPAQADGELFEHLKHLRLNSGGKPNIRSIDLEIFQL